MINKKEKFREKYERFFEMVTIGSLNMFFEKGKMFDSGIAYCFEVN